MYCYKKKKKMIDKGKAVLYNINIKEDEAHFQGGLWWNKSAVGANFMRFTANPNSL